MRDGLFASPPRGCGYSKTLSTGFTLPQVAYVIVLLSLDRDPSGDGLVYVCCLLCRGFHVRLGTWEPTSQFGEASDVPGLGSAPR